MRGRLYNIQYNLHKATVRSGFSCIVAQFHTYKYLFNLWSNIFWHKVCEYFVCKV